MSSIIFPGLPPTRLHVALQHQQMSVSQCLKPSAEHGRRRRLWQLNEKSGVYVIRNTAPFFRLIWSCTYQHPLSLKNLDLRASRTQGPVRHIHGKRTLILCTCGPPLHSKTTGCSFNQSTNSGLVPDFPKQQITSSSLSCVCRACCRPLGKAWLRCGKEMLWTLMPVPTAPLQ